MSEVEKMYKNANIDYEDRYNDCTMDIEGECHLNIHCDLCNYSKEKYIYPPFTAEKQIELIKWMIKTKHRYFMQDIIADDFSETLAGVFNFYWQYLTEEERKQIKNILESEVRE